MGLAPWAPMRPLWGLQGPHWAPIGAPKGPHEATMGHPLGTHGAPEGPKAAPWHPQRDPKEGLYTPKLPINRPIWRRLVNFGVYPDISTPSLDLSVATLDMPVVRMII